MRVFVSHMGPLFKGDEQFLPAMSRCLWHWNASNTQSMPMSSREKLEAWGWKPDTSPSRCCHCRRYWRLYPTRSSRIISYLLSAFSQLNQAKRQILGRVIFPLYSGKKNYTEKRWLEHRVLVFHKERSSVYISCRQQKHNFTFTCAASNCSHLRYLVKMLLVLVLVLELNS